MGAENVNNQNNRHQESQSESSPEQIFEVTRRCELGVKVLQQAARRATDMSPEHLTRCLEILAKIDEEMIKLSFMRGRHDELD